MIERDPAKPDGDPDARSSSGPRGRTPLVAQILYSGLGGHGGVVTAMIRADRQRRWRHALGFLGVEPLLPAYETFCQAEDVPFQYLPAVPRRPWRSYRPVTRWLNLTRPDIVILHSGTALPGVVPYVLSRGVPLIVVEHQANELKSRQEWLFSILAMRVADAVVTLTPRYREEMQSRFGGWFRPDKVVVIPNGVDTDAFGRAAPFAVTDTGPLRIGMAARFSATKRFDVLIDAIGLLEQNDDRPWQLSLAGVGEQWDRIRADAADSRAGNIVFEGMLSGDALAEWYRSLDIYCHASDGETLSVSVLQAMASSLPVIGSKVEGITNLLDGTPPLGALVATNTGEAFAATAIGHADDPDAARAMGVRARREAERFYGHRAMFSRYAELVERLAEARLGSPDIKNEVLTRG